MALHEQDSSLDNDNARDVMTVIEINTHSHINNDNHKIRHDQNNNNKTIKLKPRPPMMVGQIQSTASYITPSYPSTVTTSF